MTKNLCSFHEVLNNIMKHSIQCWIYLPDNENWTLKSRAAVLESEEVPPEVEDEPDAGIPEFAKQNNLMQVLPVTEVQSIVKYAIKQKPDVSIDEIFESFIYYYDYDAFLELPSSGHQGSQ